MKQPWDLYTYRVSWSEEDQEHVATCVELSGLSSVEPSPEAALAGVRELAQAAVEILQRKGEPVPAPLASNQYSGEFRVRVPPELHRALALQAKEQAVSMNRLISMKLAGNAYHLRPAMSGSVELGRQKAAKRVAGRASRRASRSGTRDHG